MQIQALNEMKVDEFVQFLKDIFEHSPWVPSRAWKWGPFPSIASLHQRMVEVVETAMSEEKLRLIQSHPHLGTRERMSVSSNNEQKIAGLNQLSDEEYEAFLNLNREYVKKFGFPFILAIRGKSKEEIVSAMKERLSYSYDDEYNQALTEIYKIARFRLEEKLNPVERMEKA